MKSNSSSMVIKVAFIITLVGYASSLLFATNAVVDTAALPKPVNKYQRTQINDSTGTVVLVAAKAGVRSQIYGLTLAALTSKTMEFKSGTVSLTGPMPVNAIQIDVSSNLPWLETINVNEDLTLVLDGATNVSGQVIWQQQ